MIDKERLDKILQVVVINNNKCYDIAVRKINRLEVNNMMVIGIMLFVFGLLLSYNSVGIIGIIIGAVIASVGVMILVSFERNYISTVNSIIDSFNALSSKHNALAFKILDFDFDDLENMPEDLKELYKTLHDSGEFNKHNNEQNKATEDDKEA